VSDEETFRRGIEIACGLDDESGTLPGVNLAVIAAFTAAAVSVLNLVVTAKLTSGSQFRRWQREEARPITARLLILSREGRRAWLRIASTRRELLDVSDADSSVEGLQKRHRDQMAAAWTVSEELGSEDAALWLIATPPTREAASALVNKHQSIEMTLQWHPDYIDLPCC
jgi:hypothetical protein